MDGWILCILLVTRQAGLYLDEERKCVILTPAFSLVQRPAHVCWVIRICFNCLLLFFLWLTRAMVLPCQTHSLKARCPKDRFLENWDFLCTSQHSRSILRRRKLGKSRPFGVIVLVWADLCAVTLGRALAHGWHMLSIFEMPSLKLGVCSQLSCSWEEWAELKLVEEGTWLFTSIFSAPWAIKDKSLCSLVTSFLRSLFNFSLYFQEEIIRICHWQGGCISQMSCEGSIP